MNGQMQPLPNVPALLQFVVIIIFFVTAGPMIGSIAQILRIDLMLVFFSPSDSTPAQTFGTVIAMVPVGIGVGYFLGFVPAVLAGILVGAMQVWLGRAPWFAVLTVGLCVGVGFTVFAGGFTGAYSGPAWSRVFAHIWNVLVCLAATLICWRVSRNWFAPWSAGDRMI